MHHPVWTATLDVSTTEQTTKSAKLGFALKGNFQRRRRSVIVLSPFPFNMH